MEDYKNIKIYEFPRVYENIEIVILSLISFFLPMFLGHPQLLVGSVVNTLIVISALHHPFRKALPIIMLPSLGALTAGLLFGPLTHTLIYMIPFIWIANAILWFGIKYFYLKNKKNYLIGLSGSALFKAVFLFTIAFILFSFNLVPQIFLLIMGPMQLVTALIGGFVAKGFSEVVVRSYKA